MNRWEHLTQVPEPIRTTMTTAFIQWEKQDLGIEAVIDMVFHCQNVTDQMRKTLSSSTNSIRIPELCKIVHDAHPDRSWRDVFQAVALFTGLYYRHISRLYYVNRRSKCLN